eukprot:TRINITY_DN18463_c0_g1_i1.p1 TRINITY_DN18463_c0_g1~~TRINITY_DN18463_c0_g1_i1.p1  ORF type:complete len:397 (+),score=61.18 TRINITY_DN18463_c0_g1_i1:148-1338(+)
MGWLKVEVVGFRHPLEKHSAAGSMEQFPLQLGSVKIYKVVESAADLKLQPSRFFKSESALSKERSSGQLPKPGAPQDESYFDSEEAREVDRVVSAMDWLPPSSMDADGNMILAIQMLVIETANGKRIAVDTCVGDNKSLPGTSFHRKQSSFLNNLQSVGCPPETIDFVLCTHLHFDHVGFNTILQEGEWIPTFPNAKYLFAKKEWLAYKEEMEDGKDFIGNITVFKESVQPIVDAGLHELVESNHVLVDDGSCRVYLMPTEGHTAGHVSVVVESAGRSAIITGDALHHPAQLARPQLATFFDSNSPEAVDTRESLLQKMAERNIMMIGTHFGPPTAGFLEKKAHDARRVYRFCPYVAAVHCNSCKTARQPEILSEVPSAKQPKTNIGSDVRWAGGA